MSEEYIKEDEIDLIELLQTVWNGRKTILKFVVTFFLLGLFIAIFSPKEFVAKTVVVPQTGRSTSGGSLGGLAAMAGVDIGGGDSNSIAPSLYPKIIKSVPFLKKMLSVPLKFDYIDKEVTYEEYYKGFQKFNLLRFMKSIPGAILKLFMKGNEENVLLKVDEGIYRITENEKELFEQIEEQLYLEIDDKEGSVSLSFSMPSAESSAIMTQKAQEVLQEFITQFKINKAKEEFIFIEERCKEAKKEFDKKEYILTSFRDRNRGLSTSRSQARLQRLQSDYNLAYGVYSELAKKLETQRIEVKKQTPIFTIIEPVSVPIKKVKPKRLMIIAISIFLGLVVGAVIVLVRNAIENIKLRVK